MEFICASCLHKHEVPDERLREMARDPHIVQTCPACGAEWPEPSETMRGRRVKVWKELQPAVEEVKEALEPVARLGNRAMRKWWRFWR